MSNVNDFGSHQPEDNDNTNDPHDSPATPYEDMPFLGHSGPRIDPRKETVWNMLRFSCCPALDLVSFITFITTIDIIMYIITLSWNGLQKPSMEFLQPASTTLLEFGNRIPFLMRYDFQVWRFLTPVFLHANFLHIGFNLISQLIFGSLVESQVGTWKIVLIYFSCAIGGNLFGALVSDAAAVGASTAIVGLLGVFLALIIVNWNRMDPNLKCFLAFVAGFIILFNILYGLIGSKQTIGKGPDQVDNYGHFGGLITGIASGMALIKPAGEIVRSYEKNIRKIGIGLWAIYFLVGFIMFYTVVHPKQPAILQ